MTFFCKKVLVHHKQRNFNAEIASKMHPTATLIRKNCKLSKKICIATAKCVETQSFVAFF